jgi:hypothetical protein
MGGKSLRFFVLITASGLRSDSCSEHCSFSAKETVMWMPAISGLIERRILLNYRVDADALAKLLPRPFEPLLIDGAGVAGICLIRLRDVRPAALPGWLGLRSENVAQRIAVTWNEDGVERQGVYVPRRDTNSRLTVLAGGRLFPGVHHRARFDVDESAERYHIRVNSLDGATAVAVNATVASRLHSSLFATLADASRFFVAGSCGYSPERTPGRFEGLELDCNRWQMTPLEVTEVRSSFFDDRAKFPAGSVEFDSGLLMRNIPHQWRKLETLRAANALPDNSFARREKAACGSTPEGRSTGVTTCD